jgi:hypothetical protein
MIHPRIAAELGLGDPRTFPQIDTSAYGYSRVDNPRAGANQFKADLYRSGRVDKRTLDTQANIAFEMVTNTLPNLTENQPPQKLGGLFPNGYKLYQFEQRTPTGVVLVKGEVRFCYDLTRVKIDGPDAQVRNLVYRCLFPKPA